MPIAPAAPALPSHSLPTEVLTALLAVSLTGVIVFRPFGPPGQPDVFTDMAYVHLNPAAQRMLKLPECPPESFLTLYPHTRETGILAFYLDTFRAGTPGRYDVNYQHDGLDNFFHLAAQRSGELLVVSFTDTADQQPDAVAATLRASQAREQAARAESETRRQHLHAVLAELPAQVATNRGPAHVFELVNPRYQALFPNRAIAGRPVREALPELAGQQFFELLDQVYQSGEPFYGQEMASEVDYVGDGQLEKRYFDVSFQALRDEQGHIDGVLNFAYDVTELVRARQQAEHDRTQVQALNEQLRVLNEELENRVAARTNDLHALVTELRQAQHAQQTQQLLLTTVLTSLPAEVVTFEGEELRYTFFNDALQRRVAGRAVLGRTLDELFPEAAAQGYPDLLRQVLRTAEPYRHYEAPTFVQDPRTGERKETFLDLTYLPLRHGQEPPHGVLGFSVDVTERVLARQRAEALQAELRAATERQAAQRDTFHQVFEQTPAVIALLRGPDHRFDYYNAAYQQLFPGRALHGRTIAEVVPEVVSQGFVALLDGVYRTGTTHFGSEVSFVAEQPNGQPPLTYYFNFTYQRLEETGRPAGISIFAYDVTEQVLARQEREAQQVQLAELFEQAPVAIAVVRGPEYVMEVANPLVAELWGRTPAQVLGKTLYEALPEVRGQGFKELLDQVVASGEAFVAQEVPAQLLRAGELATVFLNFVYQPLRDAQGRIDSVAAVATDVTAQVRARQQLAEANSGLTSANARLVRTNVDLDTFIYTASHDLKQPITNIEGLLTMLREELPTPAPGLVPNLLDRMQRAVERFQLTITQLTDVSRLQQAQAQPAEVVHLAALAEDVRQDLAPALAAAGTRLTLDVAARLTVTFAPKNLRSIVYNLLSNAVKYHDPARPSVVRLRARATPVATVLEVQDNGLGLSPAQQGRLYGMFQRLHDHVEGSGIGLYMVKRIVENAGGTIAVQSAAGVGTTFTVTLPHPAG